MTTIKLTILEKIILTIKMALGSALSWEIAILFGSRYPYLAPISVILCLQATLQKSIRFGVARIVGTVIGVASVTILASKMHASGWSISVIMLVSLILPLLFRANATTLHQTALSVLLVLEFEHKLQGYGFDRIRDSLIGVVIALLLHAFLFPPNLAKKAFSLVEELPPLLANKLTSMATWLEAGAPQENYFKQDMQQIRKKRFAAGVSLEKAKLGLKFHPFPQKSRLLLQEGNLLLQTINKLEDDIDVFFTIMEEWRKTGCLPKNSLQDWQQIFIELEKSLTNWSKGKAITSRKTNETPPFESFHYPAVWHAQHMLATLKKHPYPRNQGTGKLP